jgi:hypothetical protein
LLFVVADEDKVLGRKSTARLEMSVPHEELSPAVLAGLFIKSIIVAIKTTQMCKQISGKTSNKETKRRLLEERCRIGLCQATRSAARLFLVFLLPLGALAH